jgi:hypothetical protein
VARPKKDVNPVIVGRLANIGCTMNEIAAVCDCSVDILERRFADVIKKGRETGKASLRRQQWKKACEGNVTMQIWLGKQLLGQRDVVVTDVTSAGQRIGGPDLAGLSDATKALVLKELGGPAKEEGPTA